MRAGKLRRTIQVQQQTETQLEGGQPGTDWTTWATVKAQIASAKASELRSEQFKAQQFNPETIFNVTIRTLDGLNSLHRIIVDDGRLFEILSVNPGERKGDPVDVLCKLRIAWNSGN